MISTVYRWNLAVQTVYLTTLIKFYWACSIPNWTEFKYLCFFTFSCLSHFCLWPFLFYICLLLSWNPPKKNSFSFQKMRTNVSHRYARPKMNWTFVFFLLSKVGSTFMYTSHPDTDWDIQMHFSEFCYLSYNTD